MDMILSTNEAAEHAGVSTSTILRWIRNGKLSTVNKNVTSGRGCGYKIRQSDLDSHIHGWTNVENDTPASAPQKDILILVEPKRVIRDQDLESLQIAAKNLRIVIEFAKEELDKIEALL